MTPTKSLTRYCEARTRKGGLCKREAGWGTGHVGRGRCKLHGGCSPNAERGAAREEAYEFILGQNGAQAPIEPLDAAVKAVELAHGTVEYWRAELAKAYEAEEAPTPVVVEGYRMALQDLSRMTEAANRAGVADRLVQISERWVDRLALAFEEAAQAMKLDAQTRAVGIAAYRKALAPLEGETLALAPPDGLDSRPTRTERR